MCFVLRVAYSSSYEESRDLNLHLLKNYSKFLNPIKTQSDQLLITVNMYLNSVINFDTVSGTMTFSAAFLLTWNNKIIGSRWQQSNFKDVNETRIGIHDVWVPKLYIQNSASLGLIFQFSSFLDAETSFVTYYRDGSALFSVGTILQTMCLTDVTYYPLDEHECDVTIVPHDITKIVLQTTSTEAMTPVTYTNSEWNIKSTADSFYVFGAFTQVNFKVILSRKAILITTNLVFSSYDYNNNERSSVLCPNRIRREVVVWNKSFTYVYCISDNSSGYAPTDRQLLVPFQHLYLCGTCLQLFGNVRRCYDFISPSTKQRHERFKTYCRFYKICTSKTEQGFSKTHSENSIVKSCDSKRNTDHLTSNNDQTEKVYLKKLLEVTWKDMAAAIDKVLKIVTTTFTFCLLIVFFMFILWVNIVH